MKHNTNRCLYMSKDKNGNKCGHFLVSSLCNIHVHYIKFMDVQDYTNQPTPIVSTRNTSFSGLYE